MDKTKCDPKKNKGINAKTPCKDTLGSYECVCKPGYELTPDKKDCRGNSSLQKLETRAPSTPFKSLRFLGFSGSLVANVIFD